MHYFVMKTPNKRELEQIVFIHSLDINFKDFVNLYKKQIQRQTEQTYQAKFAYSSLG